MPGTDELKLPLIEAVTEGKVTGKPDNALIKVFPRLR